MKQTMRNPKTRSNIFVSISCLELFDVLYYLFEHFPTFVDQTNVFSDLCWDHLGMCWGSFGDVLGPFFYKISVHFLNYVY